MQRLQRLREEEAAAAAAELDSADVDSKEEEVPVKRKPNAFAMVSSFHPLVLLGIFSHLPLLFCWIIYHVRIRRHHNMPRPLRFFYGYRAIAVDGDERQRR